MNLIDKITVYLNELKVGTLTLSLDGKRCLFEYSSEWIKTGFSISPLDLPLKPGVFTATDVFNGNFGVFEDSLPDGYGRYLLDRALRKEGATFSDLNPLQKLSIIGNSGMGALRYVPSIKIETTREILDFDSMQELALDVLSERDIEDNNLLYYNSGNSGGCRPKAIYMKGSEHWLIKFRHTYDDINMGQEEYKYNTFAKRCGIDVPEFELVEGKYFATKRFDIDDKGQRLHVVTAGGLLNETIYHPKLDYSTLLKLTGFLTQDSKQVEQMFRRMIFNVFVGNKDDHAKNFSFIYEDNKWKLSPAYDITYSPKGYNGEHATSVMYNGTPTIIDMITAGTEIKIKEKRCQEIIDEVHINCKEIMLDPYLKDMKNMKKRDKKTIRKIKR